MINPEGLGANVAATAYDDVIRNFINADWAASNIDNPDMAPNKTFKKAFYPHQKN